MFGWLKGIFSVPKVTDAAVEIVKKGVDGIGKCFFTEQEKAEFTMKAGEMWIRVQETLANESSIRSMTRRVLAVMILGSFLFLILGAGCVYPFDAKWAAFLLDLAKELGTLALMVAVFYFGVHVLRGLQEGKK